MTGFANMHSAADAADDGMAASPPPVLGMEIRSVNSRFLDLTFKLADDLRGTEPALRELLTAQLKRGKVEIRAWIEGRGDDNLKPPSSTELQRLLNAQDNVRAWLPQAAPLSVAEVMQLVRRQTALPTDFQDRLMKLATQTVAALRQARAREGERLTLMLKGHAAQLGELAAQAKPMVPQLVEQQRQRFLERWREALGQTGQASDSEVARDRALTEATTFAIRIDVAEELTRLASHVDEINRLLDAGGELGKRLDFLIQELHREANTLGSKSSSLELTRISVDMKVLIEQMREQVQNIE
jgi:uncharacterized protein (TIGR00255 family)